MSGQDWTLALLALVALAILGGRAYGIFQGFHDFRHARGRR